jgi:DNA-binding response OmpR family regulator
VLVVEDEPAIRGLLSLTLEAEHYDVTTAEDGAQALDQVHRQKPDAILLDLMLPNVDGWQVIEVLDHDTQAAHIPIITMSAVGRWDAVGERGVKAYLSKPFDIETLLVVLEDVLQ